MSWQRVYYYNLPLPCISFMQPETCGLWNFDEPMRYMIYLFLAFEIIKDYVLFVFAHFIMGWKAKKTKDQMPLSKVCAAAKHVKVWQQMIRSIFSFCFSLLYIFTFTIENVLIWSLWSLNNSIAAQFGYVGLRKSFLDNTHGDSNSFPHVRCATTRTKIVISNSKELNYPIYFLVLLTPSFALHQRYKNEYNLVHKIYIQFYPIKVKNLKIKK